MTTQSARIAIAGASGYGGAEALRWLADHPHAHVCAASSRRWAGKSVADMHPQLAGFHQGTPIVPDPLALLDSSPDAVILALPHGHAAEHAYALVREAPGLRLVDLSGDHRLPDPEAYATAYSIQHPHPEVLGTGAWMYGFTEANRDWVRGTNTVANPGCFATGALIGALPLTSRGLVTGAVRHAAITGSSGSGATAKAATHHPERTGNVRAYKVLAHQHVAEVLSSLASHGLDPDTPWLMVPHSGPFVRGIFTTLFLELTETLPTADLRALFDERYGGEPLIRMRDGTPSLGHVRNTAFCDVSVESRDRHAVVMTAIDNLGKGMVTQAIQNLNLLFGWEETAGLLRPGARV